MRVSNNKPEGALVSIIIPVYNAERWINECIKSVTSQTYTNWEMIIIDDGSTDRSVELLQNFQAKIRLFRQDNKGQVNATARGLQAANGEFVAFLDSDDIWLPNKLSQQVAYLHSRPDIDVLYTNAEEFRVLGFDHKPYTELHPKLRNPDHVMEAMLERQIPLRSTVMLKRSFLLESGVETDPLSGSVDDIGLFMEIAGHGGKFGYLDQITTYRRMHGGNFSSDHFKRFSSRIPMYHRLLSRSKACPYEWRTIVFKALSDAEFRVGEYYWGNNDKKKARDHFWNAWCADFWNLRSLFVLFCTSLPDSVIYHARRIKKSFN